MMEKFAMAENNVGERAEMRGRRGRQMLVVLALVAATVQLGTALAQRSDVTLPAAASIAIAAAVAGLMLYLFRAEERFTDEVARQQTDRVLGGAMKNMFVAFPAWLILQQAELVPELSGVGLLGFLFAMILFQIVLCQLRR